ncbi:MAG: hypothetical protein U0S48_16545 [Solirubrobacteraceae bacterium]
MQAMNTNRDALAARLAQEDALELMDRRPRTLVIAQVRDGEDFTATDLVGELAQRRGWMVPAYELPPANDDRQIMRMMVKINQSRELADALADDMHASIVDLPSGAAGQAVTRPRAQGHSY